MDWQLASIGAAMGSLLFGLIRTRSACNPFAADATGAASLIGRGHRDRLDGLPLTVTLDGSHSYDSNSNAHLTSYHFDFGAALVEQRRRFQCALATPDNEHFFRNKPLEVTMFRCVRR